METANLSMPNAGYVTSLVKQAQENIETQNSVNQQKQETKKQEKTPNKDFFPKALLWTAFLGTLLIQGAALTKKQTSSPVQKMSPEVENTLAEIQLRIDSLTGKIESETSKVLVQIDELQKQSAKPYESIANMLNEMYQQTQNILGDDFDKIIENLKNESNAVIKNTEQIDSAIKTANKTLKELQERITKLFSEANNKKDVTLLEGVDTLTKNQAKSFEVLEELRILVQKYENYLSCLSYKEKQQGCFLTDIEFQNGTAFLKANNEKFSGTIKDVLKNGNGIELTYKDGEIASSVVNDVKNNRLITRIYNKLSTQKDNGFFVSEVTTRQDSSSPIIRIANRTRFLKPDEKISKSDVFTIFEKDFDKKTKKEVLFHQRMKDGKVIYDARNSQNSRIIEVFDDGRTQIINHDLKFGEKGQDKDGFQLFRIIRPAHK